MSIVEAAWREGAKERVIIAGRSPKATHSEPNLKPDWRVCASSRAWRSALTDGCAPTAPLSCRYAAQSSTAIKQVKAWMPRAEEQGPESLGQASAEPNTVLICAPTVPENGAMYF